MRGAAAARAAPRRPRLGRDFLARRGAPRPGIRPVDAEDVEAWLGPELADRRARALPRLRRHARADRRPPDQARLDARHARARSPRARRAATPRSPSSRAARSPTCARASICRRRLRRQPRPRDRGAGHRPASCTRTSPTSSERSRELADGARASIDERGRLAGGEGRVADAPLPRGDRPPRRADRRARAHAIVRDAGFQARDALCAVEARPPIGWDKGRAVLHLLRERHGPAWSERLSRRLRRRRRHRRGRLPHAPGPRRHVPRRPRRAPDARDAPPPERRGRRDAAALDRRSPAAARRRERA